MRTATSMQTGGRKPRRRLRALAAVCCFVLGASGPAYAQVPLPERGALHGSGIILLSQEVVVRADPIDVVSVSGTTVALVLTSSGAGAGLDDDTDSATSYSITTNGANKKLTGALDQAYASGITLAVTLAAPSGATSAGEVVLTTTAQTLVTGITRVADGTLTITYRASAPLGTAPNGGETNTVTITLTDM